MEDFNEVKTKFIRDKKKFLSPKEFSQEYGIGINRTYEMIHIEGFPCIFAGRKCLILTDKVDKWFEDNIGLKF